MNPTLQRHKYYTELTEIDDLLATVYALESKDAMVGFLQDLCTRQELKVLAGRWRIVKLVHLGFPYRAVSNKTGASSATISRIANHMTYGSGHLANVCRMREGKIKLECQE